MQLTEDSEHRIRRDSVARTLIAKGIRPTSHRLAIACHVLESHRHFTAEDIFSWSKVHLAKVSRATVYNTLNEMANAGLLRCFQPSGAARAVFDSNTQDHFHLIDTETQNLIDVDMSMIELKPEFLAQFEVSQVEIVVKGRVKFASDEA